jgi:RNA polymerase sigma-70 factor, ECF subfamily
LQNQDIEKEFESRISEHEPLIHKVCRIYAYTQADRQDLFQEIVIQLWRSYPRFKGEAKFSTWLYRVALNTAISGLRKQKDFITSVEPDKLPNHPHVEYTDDEEEQIHELYRAIAMLNEVEKAVVMLFLEDKSYEEMEDIMGINQGTLRVKMSRIKDKLRQLTKND